MTIWGLDASNNNAPGLDLRAAEKQGYCFFMAKVTEGRTFVDQDFNIFRAQAIEAGGLFSAYHWLHSDSSVISQADHVAATLTDKSIPLWVDIEPTGPSKPTFAHYTQFKAAAAKRGLNVVGAYYPRWYWQETNSPALGGVNLWASDYGQNLPGYGSALYPGDTSPRWGTYGGGIVRILQFGSRGRLDGYNGDLDVSAFKGTREELAASGLFKDYANHPAQGKVGAVYAATALQSVRATQAALGRVAVGKGPLWLQITAANAALNAVAGGLQKRVNGG